MDRDFTPKVDNGQATSLQVREICTYETDETNPESGGFDLTVKKAECKGPWKTVATNKQNSNGDSTFAIPSKLEAKNTAPCYLRHRQVERGLVRILPPEPRSLWVSHRVHFYTYEGHAAASTSTATSKASSPCGPRPPPDSPAATSPHPEVDDEGPR